MPAERRDHATVLLCTDKHPRLFLTGGFDKSWHSLDDAWILDLEKEAGKINQGFWHKVIMCFINLGSIALY